MIGGFGVAGVAWAGRAAGSVIRAGWAAGTAGAGRAGAGVVAGVGVTAAAGVACGTASFWKKSVCGALRGVTGGGNSLEWASGRGPDGGVGAAAPAASQPSAARLVSVRAAVVGRAVVGRFLRNE